MSRSSEVQGQMLHVCEKAVTLATMCVRLK